MGQAKARATEIKELKENASTITNEIKKLFSSNTECAFDKLNIAEPGSLDQYIKV